MSIQQTKKQSDLEKRLRLLRQQVYGRASEHSENSVNQHLTSSEQKVRTEGQMIRNSDTPIHRYSDYSGTPKSSESFRSDLTYLRHDLIKIGTLTSAAFGIQAILYFLLQHNLVRLNFF